MTAEKYKIETEKLFSEWKDMPLHKDKVFVKDGVINPEVFYSNNIRPLFILKEAYDKDESNNDIADEHNINVGEDIRQENSTWPNISRWTYGLFNTTKEKKVEYVDQENFCLKKNEYLQKIAVVNVKKSDGQPKSNDSNLNKYAKNDKEKLRKQIEIIDPTVIVCGNSFSRLRIIFPEINTLENDKHFTRFELNGHSVLVLDCYHPSCRRSPKNLYNIFVDLYYQSLQE